MTDDKAAAPKKVKAVLVFDASQTEWLQSMAQKHSLPDADKTLRIVLTYALAVDLTAQVEALPQQEASSSLQAPQTYTIESFHEEYLTRLQAPLGAKDLSEVARRLLASVQSSADEAAVFGTIRCKHPAGCTFCK